MHAVITAILSQGDPGSWPVSAVTPENVAKLLGRTALTMHAKDLSKTNRRNARKPRADDGQLAQARATFNAWGGATMTPGKLRECELHVAKELGTNRPKITRWFAYFIEHSDLS
ncbi:hypothetical protein [Paraburkholderia ferrariae]|uniref:hypothetical protein n=1 Tax=Paraburkholderia ferrariae TaxID=386056 RepID=UPI000484FE81|nr:hypothetical protein [Paraburkholderia ferrariae]